jgi:uncharacterized membrane protein YccF (DUF307 family)
MSFLCNVLWFLLGGIFLGGGWLLAGIFWCVTIIGIPWGVQCFKFARLMFAPFGKEVVYGGGLGSFLLNVVWLLISGLPLAAMSLVVGCLLCLTIVGIPLGLQCFKYAKLALMPFGSRVI